MTWWQILLMCAAFSGIAVLMEWSAKRQAERWAGKREQPAEDE